MIDYSSDTKTVYISSRHFSHFSSAILRGDYPGFNFWINDVKVSRRDLYNICSDYNRLLKNSTQQLIECDEKTVGGVLSKCLLRSDVFDVKFSWSMI